MPYHAAQRASMTARSCWAGMSLHARNTAAYSRISQVQGSTLPLVALDMSLLLKVYSAARPVPSLGCSLYMSAVISSCAMCELLSANIWTPHSACAYWRSVPLAALQVSHKLCNHNVP